MSYIDSFDHEFVGYFGGIAVYHPLEVVPQNPGDYPRDFACGPENLVIGGGSGEWPGLVIREPGETIACFVRAWLRECASRSDEPQALQSAIEAWPDASAPKTPGYWPSLFDFAGWQVADFVAFSRRCASRAFTRPFAPAHDGSLEMWLAASVGEFIFCALPELAPKPIQRLGDLRRHISGDLYRNILLLPPGYPVWGRREENNQVTWGVSAWRIERAPHPETKRL